MSMIPSLSSVGEDAELAAIREAFKQKTSPQGLTEEAPAVQVVATANTKKPVFVLTGNREDTAPYERIEDPADPDSFFILQDNTLSYYADVTNTDFLQELIVPEDESPSTVWQFVKKYHFVTIEAFDEIARAVFGICMRQAIYILPKLPTSFRSVQFDLASDIYNQMKLNAQNDLERKRLNMSATHWFDRSQNREEDPNRKPFSLKKKV